MPNKGQQEFQQAFLRLQQTYIRRLENTVRIIDNIFDLEKLSPLVRTDLLRVQSLVHGLAGSGSTFGYPEISQEGAKADYFISALLKSDQDVLDYAPLMPMLDKIRQACRTTAHKAYLTIPIPKKDEVPANTGIKGSRQVLIVDDDGDIAALIAQILAASGMLVKVCASGEEALHDLPRIQPDLVILDVALTGIDGLEVLKQIKQNPEFLDIPVIIICTRHNHDIEAIALRAGAQAFIAKPLDIQTFSQFVKTITGENKISFQASS